MPGLCGTVHSNIADNTKESRMQTALENAASRLSSNTQQTYWAYGPDNHGWNASPDNLPSDGVDVYLNNFANSISNADANNDITTFPGDVWVILDGLEDHGYGDGNREFDVNLGGNSSATLHVGRALSLETSFIALDPKQFSKVIIRHNLGHNFEADHENGGYSYTSGNGVFDVTPMAWSYVRMNETCSPYNCFYETDTDFGGSDSPPSSFDAGGSNYRSNVEFCGDYTNACRHRMDYSLPTMNVIESHTPRPG